MKPICTIEIIKDGIYFVARTQAANGKSKEYTASGGTKLDVKVVSDKPVLYRAEMNISFEIERK